MKRFAYVAIATAALVFGVGACKKAHDAGNDSMNAGHSGISASIEQSSGQSNPTQTATGLQSSKPYPSCPNDERAFVKTARAVHGGAGGSTS
jgi:hypothetical protein